MSELQDAIRSFECEVEHEAAEMIRRGTPPFEAIERARNLVRRRRADAEFKKHNSQEPERA